MKLKITLRLILLSILTIFVTVGAQSQTITLTQPNGGEILYACQQYNVQWNQTGNPSNYWNIDYSLDGGTIWTSVASNFLSANGSFLWTVPNVQSSTVLMRVFDAQNVSTVDQSNANFTINIPLILTSPNGGEVWQGNTVHNITWNAQGTSNTYNIAYSTNSGSTWTNIVTNYANVTGSYVWTIPAMAQTTTCMVRVQDYVTNCKQDVSNTVFTITPPTPIVTAPNGGEVLQVQCTTTITWNSSTFFSSVRIDYSLDNGVTWINITTSTSNDGTQNWTVPANTPSTQCKIKISNTADLNIFDVSDATFTIATPITVTAPNGGENLIGCATVPITFAKSSCIQYFNIFYSTDNGTTWNSITSGLSNNGLATQTYNWQVPNGITSAQALIRVEDYYYTATNFDVSNAVFNFTPSNDITVTSANGGEVWQGLSTHAITWTNLPTASGQYTLQYSLNNGSSWNSITTNITGNSYNWSVPNSPSTSCLIKVIDYVNNCKFDVSNAVFTINAPQPLLTAPNGGEVLQVQCTTTITWNSSTFFSSVRIDYSLDNGVTWINITTSTSNDGTQNWTVPANTPSTQCKIKISNTADLNIFDVSDATFTIATPITVTAPNGGENLIGCATVPITFAKSSCIQYFNIFYSTDNGTTWNSITSGLSNNGLATQTYNWQVPNGITSAQALIRVEDYYYTATNFDASNAVFNFTPSNDITVTSANGGEVWQGLSTHAITWTNLPTASGQYTLQYSLNNGSSWNSITTNITGNSYNWSVPNSPSTSCLIKVIDYVNNCKFDVSNAVFTINAPQPLLTAPNGGEVLQVQCTTTITWNSSTFFSSVRIDYSLDNGVTWINITTSTSNDGTQNWTVPANTPSTQCKIKISNTADLNIFDVSDATFTIATPITVTAPNGGENLIGCATVPITFAKSSCIQYFNIFYSTDNGTTWNSITSGLSNNGLATQTYNWQVPNGITSAQALIRVEDYYYTATNFDVSNAVFNFTPSNDITVTSANGGEVWQGLSTHAITWTNLPTASGQYTLQYSLNNGSSWNSITTNITGNSYNWSVPNSPSTSCLIKVIDYVNNCKFDVSNAVFTINAPQPLLTAPNGGEVLQVQCTTTITWNSSTFFSSVRIDYSLDNGVTWINITTSTSNDGTQNWTVPANTPSTQCKIKISNTADLNIFDVSDATFTIATPITVTAPNGGENLIGCATVPITFAKSSCIQYFNIFYSTDNGTTWNSITSGLSNNGLATQTYNWQVPNGITSAQALIRVEDYYYTATNFDASNAVFNFTPSNDITVTSANGGEVWQGLSTHAITWTNLPTASGQYTLQYSLNNGSSWNSITTNITGNSYNWSVPNSPSTSCLIKVIDYVNNCKFDVSNAVFTINAPQPLLTAPNGGEVLQVQCTTTITWNSSTFFSSVRIDYSLDNGVTWINITTSTSNDGTQNWTVPANTPSTQCKIKISNTADLNIFDVSDATFTIATPITVTAPNGGENLIGCATVPITFAKSSCIQYFNIFYSTDNGTTWNSITSGLSNNGLATQTYNWQVPNGITSAQALIRVEDYYYTATNFDASNAVFNFTPSNDITVTSANGGEVWQGLSTHAITWTNLPTASGQYTLQYSLNNGSSWNSITTNITGNSYNWSVPNSPSTSCLIKVIDYVNNCKYDVSNAVFTISPATPIVLTPNGGESYYAGTTQTITWNSATYFSSVRLDYSLDNGVTWINITTSTSNDGTQNWTVPNASSALCLIKVSNTADLNIYDVSNTNFTIKPAVTIITPNGDNGVTIWGGCTVTSITFDRSPAWSDYIIEYSLNNGSTWNSISTFWSTTANPATYNWSIPNTPSNQVKVRVIPYYASSNGDESDNAFTITKPVTIIQPNFGGIMQIGTNYNIQWSSDGISNLYDIFYSTNGGSSFTNIVTGYNTSTNTYSWLVPAIPSNNCRILVRDNINFCKADTSDIAFIISTSAPAITLTSPNGIADTLYGCQTKTITWNETNAINTYNIAYSLNAGVSWTNIATNYTTNTDTYNWIVPNTINSSNVLLRVQSASAPNTIFDLSDAYFTILNGNLVATPSFTSVCSSIPVQLYASGGSNYSWTPTTGLNNPGIANPIATPPTTTTYIVQSTNGTCILSDTVVIQVTTSGTTASLSIAPSVSGSICAGTSVTFTATPQNEGTSPTYVWKVNGATVGFNSTTYTSSTLNNNDIVTCIMSSNLPCVAGSPATSNAVTMLVNSVANPTVSVLSAPGTTICQGSNVTFTAVPVNGGSSPSYQWKLNGADVGTGGVTYSNSGLTNGDIITVVLTSNSACATQPVVTSSNTVITVNALPSQPGSITGNINQCTGQVVNYSVATVAGATSYQWTLPAGWTGSSTTNSISATVGAAGGNISVGGINSCGTGGIQTLSINVNSTPLMPSAIIGNTAICASSQQTYSVNPIVGATAYTWSLPNGWTGSSTTNSIDVTAGTLGGNITVTANNSCGNSAAQIIAISINNIPSAPGPISGLTSICEGTSENYVVNSIVGATSYTWTLPNGWTGSSNSNSINVTAGSTGGNITVTATFSCGTSAPQTLPVTVLTIPILSGSIAGNSSVCDGSTEIFSIPAVSGASSYLWISPSDWTVTGNTNSVTMNVGSISGNVTVAAENACGISTGLTMAVSVSTVPPQPGVIAGNTTLCGGSTNTYSIVPVAGASNYSWTLPSDWSGASTTASINATAGSASGIITVSANNSCGTSSVQNLTITTNNAPVLPVTINGSTAICENATETYSVTPDANALSYVWTLPNGWTGTSTSDIITVNANTTGGIITVAASNGCGTSAIQSLSVLVTNVPPTLDPIIGSVELCAGTATYAVPIMAGAASYDWTLPPGWTGTSTTNSIDVLTSAGAGTIIVSAVNGCGNSAPQSLSININALPNVMLDLTPIAIQCSSETSVTLVGGLPAGGTYAGSSVGAGIFNPNLAGVGNHIIQYAFVDSNNCSAYAYDSILVDVCIGIEENENALVNVYPNPGNGLMNVILPTTAQTVYCEVYNAAGMKVKVVNLNSKSNLIDITEFANGLYLLKIQHTHRIETIHYIKQ